MAKTISSEELQFRKRARRRLIGAIALVLVAVVVLPMVLDQEPRPVSEPIDIRIPPKEGAPELKHPAEPSKAAEGSKPAPLPVPAEQPRAGMSPAAAEPAAKEAPAVPASAGAKPTPGTPSTATPSDAYVVQVGAFSSAENAKQLKDKLSSNGIQAYTETVATAQGNQIRVRVGPFPTREAAEQTLEKVKKLGLNGIVTSP